MTFPRYASLAVLALAACSQEPEAPEAPGPTATRAAPPAPAPSIIPESLIPAAYQGAWDRTDGTCKGDSDRRMEIGGREIHFYESVGEVQRVREADGALSVDLAMEGEGMQWAQTTVLRMVDGGLLETEHDDPSGEGKMRLKRCPGETGTP